jgi:hypothetical protein
LFTISVDTILAQTPLSMTSQTFPFGVVYDEKDEHPPYYY